MSYIDKINVNGTTYDFGVDLSNVRDSHGNQRFIEGTPTVVSAIEDIVVYAKWSLSGTHLMLVLALYNGTENDITISQYSNFCNFDSMANFIYSKIYPTNPNSNILGNVNGLSNIACTKPSNYSVQFVAFQNITFEAHKEYRLQFDLLIDTD